MGKQKLIGVSNNIVTVKNEIQTDIFNGGTSEFFINMNPKDIPPKEHEDRGDFVRREKKKCREGITIGGIWIPGRLYYFLNYHKMTIDILEKGTGEILRKVANPLLRDNDWEIFENYEQAQKDKEVFLIGSGRQVGKSQILSALTTYEINLKPNAEALLLFTNSADKETVVKIIQTAMKDGEKFMYLPNIDNDWKKTQIRFGTTNKDNTTDVRARLFMYNTAGDNKGEIAAGKCLLHGSTVYYSDKQGVIEEVKVGDRIYGRDGELTTVTGVYPQGLVDMFEITFSDRRKVTCCGNHLWKVFRIDKHTKAPFPLILNTKELIQTYKRKYYNTKLDKEVSVNRYKIPVNSCINYPSKKVTIDPYYLGLYLGDGSTSQANHITNIDEEIISYIDKFSQEHNCYLRSKGKEHRIKSDTTGINPINKLFKEYGLRGYKFIPDDYLYNDKETRLQLLRGIMDTDGTVDITGRIEIDLSDKRLHEDVLKLIRSLGISCSTSTKKAYYVKDGKRHYCKLSYRIYLGIVTNEILFNLTRKKERQQKAIPKQSIQLGASIIDIKPVVKGLGTCISVDNEDKLFLTNDFIPTHNTLTFFAMDEIAKESILEAYTALKPALVSIYGKRCAGYMSFTGGNVEKSKDAETIFFEPGAYTVKKFVNEGKETGFFLPGTYRQDFKHEVPFSDYLSNRGHVVEKGTELDKMKIFVTDYERANAVLDQEQVDAAKTRDPTALLKHKMYFPRSIKEMFTKGNTLGFKPEYIRQQREYIKSGAVDITPVELFRNSQTGEVKHKISEKSHPFVFDWKNPGFTTDAAIAIYDFPKYTSHGVHVIGCLPPDEKVMTQKGLMNIQDVSLKDKLISEKGDLVEIKNLQKYLVEDEDLYELTLGSTCRTTKFTKEHPILTSKDKTKFISKIRQQREGLKQRYKDFNFSYKPVSETEEGDWIKVPNTYRRKQEFDYRKLWDEIDCRNCNKLINPMDNKDFWWLVGLFLGDGWCDKQRVSFAFNRKELYYIEKFKFIIKELFDKENVSIGERIGSIELYIFSVKLHTFLTNNFGKYASGKSIPEWVKYLKPEFKQELLRGYLNSDGCVGFNKTGNTLTTEFVSINLEMLESFQDILFSLGFTSSLKLLRDEKSIMIVGRMCETRKCYSLNLAHYESEKFLNSIFDEEDPKISKVLQAGVHQKAGKKNCFFSDDLEYIYFKIKKIEKSKYSGWVHNFECDTNTFMCHHITTHNCDPIREDEVGSSNSLGYITVLRRMHSDLTDPFRGKQVASYLGRCKTVKEFHQMLLNLAEWYNAQILYEHSDRDLLSFFENKHKGYLLMDTVKFQQEINVTTKTKNPKGLRPTPTNKKFLINSTLGWVNDEMEDDTLGYSGIFDDILLQQLEAYDPDENLDAYIGFSHAVAAYNYFEKFGTPVVTLNNEIKEKKKEPTSIKNAFGITFKRKPTNAFGL